MRARQRKNEVKRTLSWLLILWCAASDPAVHAQEGERLNQFKAVFMYNFVDYLSWPSQDGEKASEFTIGLLGHTPIEALLNKIAEKKKVGGRQLRVVTYTDIEQLGSCQMLFVTSAFTQHLDDLKQRLGSRNVLTVSDSPGLAERGVAINFVVVEGKLKFEINTMTLKKAGLRASSQLLKLATLIPVPVPVIVTESP